MAGSEQNKRAPAPGVRYGSPLANSRRATASSGKTGGVGDALEVRRSRRTLGARRVVTTVSRGTRARMSSSIWRAQNTWYRAPSYAEHCHAVVPYATRVMTIDYKSARSAVPSGFNRGWTPPTAFELTAPSTTSAATVSPRSSSGCPSQTTRRFERFNPGAQILTRPAGHNAYSTSSARSTAPMAGANRNQVDVPQSGAEYRSRLQ
jgi:hypothetical protein